MVKVSTQSHSAHTEQHADRIKKQTIERTGDLLNILEGCQATPRRQGEGEGRAQDFFPICDVPCRQGFERQSLMNWIPLRLVPQYLQVSLPTLYRWAKQAKPPVRMVKMGGRWMVWKPDLTQ